VRRAAEDGETPDVKVTAEDEAAARASVGRASRGAVLGAVVLAVASLIIAGVLVTAVWPTLSGVGLGLAMAAMTIVLQAVPLALVTGMGINRSVRSMAESIARERELTAAGIRREFETRLGNALEMAANEWEVLSVTGRAVTSLVGDERVEILLADNSNAHLERALVSGADPDGPGCPVQSPSQCVAARRGQTQVFSDSDALDACPHLQGREYGRCSAVCVPVSIMGRTTGVVHWAGAVSGRPDRQVVDQLEVLANQSGARIGMIRVVAESQLQATTDHLTGLLNRRAFEAKIRDLNHNETPFSLVMADLDHFKQLNDTHGHDAGDRALRVFVSVLRSELRPGDLACRYGGEEFVLALPNCDGASAARVCDRIREALALAGLDGSIPVFTCSFGVAPPRASTARSRCSPAASVWPRHDSARRCRTSWRRPTQLSTRPSTQAGIARWCWTRCAAPRSKHGSPWSPAPTDSRLIALSPRRGGSRPSSSPGTLPPRRPRRCRGSR
jgi:diguanylate cyclase (GGDEF)-like protein